MKVGSLPVSTWWLCEAISVVENQEGFWEIDALFITKEVQLAPIKNGANIKLTHYSGWVKYQDFQVSFPNVRYRCRNEKLAGELIWMIDNKIYTVTYEMVTLN